MATVLTLVSDKVKQGFTLLELMIAIAIIGILASIAVPAYNTYIYKARVSELLAGASPTILAVNEFVIANALTAKPTNYPATSVAGPTGSNIATIATDATGKITVTGKANTGATTATIITYDPTVDATGNISWKCTSGPASNQKYAPATCQN